MVRGQGVVADGSFQEKVEAEDDEQVEPGVRGPPGRGHEVGDQQTRAVEHDGVQPVHLGHHQVLEPGHAVEHLEDQVLLLVRACLELQQHVPHVVLAGLDGAAEVGTVLEELPVVLQGLLLTLQDDSLHLEGLLHGSADLVGAGG